MAHDVRTDDLELPLDRPGATRRTFLKAAGFGVAAATLAGCSRAPTRHVVPRLDQGGPLPGRPYWIATTCAGCSAGCGVLAKSRDGRPVKLEGNPDHALTKGGLCAVGQASLLELYDGRRLDGARLRGSPVPWAEADGAVREALASARGVRVLTGTVTSPSTRAAIERFVGRFRGEHVEYDPLSSSALLDAHEACFGVRALPHVSIERASVIASFGADFLGTWISPVEFAKGYAEARRPDGGNPRMCRHVQLEARMSLTGTCADERVLLAPWETGAALAALCRMIAGHAGVQTPLGDGAGSPPQQAVLESLAAELWAARGAALVLCGSDDTETQILAAYANHLLGSYGSTLDVAWPSYQARGNDRALARLVTDMAAGAVDVLIVQGVNPLYDLADEVGFAEAVAKVGLVVGCGPMDDETAAVAHVLAPEPHYLESWNDAEPVRAHLSLTQPAIPRLRSTRTLRESLARWTDDARSDLELLRDHWQKAVFPRASARADFTTFFDGALHDGYVRLLGIFSAPRFDVAAVRAPAAAAAAPAGDALALVLYPKVGLRAGEHAHNPWLQELPDPVTKVVWDNYACLSPATAARLGLRPGDVVELGAGVELPVRLQPGQDDRVVAVALGYGRKGTDRFERIGPAWLEARRTVGPGETVGRRALSLTGPITLRPTGAQRELAATQRHHSLELPAHLAPHGAAVRDAVLSTTLAEWIDDPAQALARHRPPAADMWPADHPTSGELWGLCVDLTACIGCSGCVVACQAENNVPVVGRDEVRRHREMTWLRVDRYYTGHDETLQVAHQPMMCQHCGNAPCETVCPVLATVHSEDGLSQQVYNRCVGTRYCANNCPYKVRRFNWFEYGHEDDLRNLALNPDVTIRSRGVMEKCSMCVQRIQEARAEAARLGRAPADGEIRTACEQSCPTDAITFGNRSDADSRLSQRTATPRSYAVLGELNVQPAVTYLAQIRNRPPRRTEKRHD